jgi:hypothetical protein
MPVLGLDRRRSSLLDAVNARRVELADQLRQATPEPAQRPRGTPSLFEHCANPGCRTGWIKLWRSRSAPIFEGAWTCSAECTAALVSTALGREMDGRGVSSDTHRHRIPLGLLMLQKGWITQQQLRAAVDAQKAAGAGRLGHWLMRQQSVNEQMIARAIALQWACPVLGMEFHDAEGLTSVVPRLFVDAFGALPLRVAAGKILYLGYEDRLDPVLALAVERMTGLRVESGIVMESDFRPAHTRMLSARFPAVELLEAASEPVLVQAIAKRLERVKPVEAKLVRVHDCLWLRMWRRQQHLPVPDLDGVEDVICSVRPS